MYFKQTDRYDAWRTKVQADYNVWHDAGGKITSGIITRDATSYDQWEKMHDGVIWYDTAACLTGNFIGQINESRFTPKNINRPTTLDA